MTNVLTSTVIKEHLNNADIIIAKYLSEIDYIYEDANLDDEDVVLKLKQLLNIIVDDVRLDNLKRVREWIITYIYTLCEDITA